MLDSFYRAFVAEQRYLLYLDGLKVTIEICHCNSYWCSTWYDLGVNALDGRAERKEYTFIEDRIRVH